MTSKYLFVFAYNMLSNISKFELTALTRNMRAATSLHKDFLPQNRKALAGVAQVQSDQDEQTTSNLVFKRKRLETPPIEHTHLDGRAPNQEVITIQECEAESSQKKSLWDPDFDIPTHGEFFFPGEDKARLMAHDEDHLRHDVEKFLDQAFALTCLVNNKVKDQKSRGSKS